jgi:sugar phosphate isomerase/epimerase
MNRRTFLSQTALSTVALATTRLQAAAPGAKLMLGMDHFSTRATGWKAAQIIEHAASLKLDTVFLSELSTLESFEDAYLQGVKDQADKAGLKLYTGTGSICPTSNTWKTTYGTPEEHMALNIRVAKKLGSPVARCYLGNQKDRSGDGGIQRHIDEVLKVLKASKSKAEGEGIKISLENHAGDMQSQELKSVIEAAGKEFVGVNIDPGNAVWAMEEPMHHLETLGPYTNCSSVRDSMAWENDDGAVIQWTAIGEGLVDFKAYAKRFAELAPGVPLQVETISGFPRPMPWKKEEYFKVFPANYRDTPAFADWLAFTKRGKEIPTVKAPEGPGKKDAEIAYQKAELQKSIEWLQKNV